MARVKIVLNGDDTQIEIDGRRIESCVRKIVVTAEVCEVTLVHMEFYPSSVEITGEAIAEMAYRGAVDVTPKGRFFFKRETESSQ